MAKLYKLSHSTYKTKYHLVWISKPEKQVQSTQVVLSYALQGVAVN